MSNDHVHKTFVPILKAISGEVDPREPDHSRTGIFVYHDCAYCDSGKKPCKQSSPNRCDNPRARND